MKSMTGFGVGRAPLGAGRIEVELRAVNHRFLDVRVRAPRELADLCMHVELLARQRLKRGRYEILIRTEGVAIPAAVLDAGRAEAAYRALCQVRDHVAPGADVPFSMLGSVPDIFVSAGDGAREATLIAVERAFDASLQAADAMRTAEGQAMRNDLSARLQTLRMHVATIASRRSEVVEAHRKRLLERVQRLLAATDTPVDPGRIEQEVALAADRSDVEEELTRLQSHFEQFERISASQEPMGRRLDFLLQEMAREANTIGAKNQDASTAHAVVDLKAEIERMREQVQNVE